MRVGIVIDRNAYERVVGDVDEVLVERLRAKQGIAGVVGTTKSMLSSSARAVSGAVFIKASAWSSSCMEVLSVRHATKSSAATSVRSMPMCFISCMV